MTQILGCAECGGTVEPVVAAVIGAATFVPYLLPGVRTRVASFFRRLVGR